MKFNKLIQLLEKNKTTASLSKNSEEGRKERANDVNIISINKYTPSTAPKDKPLNKGWKLWEVETLSKEKIEGRTHSSYVVLDNNNNVRDVYCSCGDFQFLWRYALTKDDLASWETYPEYTDIESKGPHTEEPSDITNPSYDKKLCKHLIKIFDKLNI